MIDSMGLEKSVNDPENALNFQASGTTGQQAFVQSEKGNPDVLIENLHLASGLAHEELINLLHDDHFNHLF